MAFYASKDIHIHIPEGATPKDGPSAGITMCVALVSALTKNPTLPDVAMTGELTLRGRVLSIGGLKEKLLAAQQHDIKTVLVPKENADDVDEILKEIKINLNIVFVDNMDEVLKQALSHDPFKKNNSKIAHEKKRKELSNKKKSRK